MDHTKLDLFVIDEKSNLPWQADPHRGAGEPFRSLLGYFISFEPPSYLSIMQCLKHAIWPKTYVAEKYPEIKNAWIQDGIPETLVVDNGKDFISSHFEDACFDIGTKIEYTPIKKLGTRKGERFFGTLVTSLLHELPERPFPTSSTRVTTTRKNTPSSPSTPCTGYFTCGSSTTTTKLITKG
jgi:putative transposase